MSEYEITPTASQTPGTPIVTTGPVYAYETTSGNDWTRFIGDMHSGHVVEIDEEMLDYWLEALPPIYMGRTGLERESLAPLGAHHLFGFAEGRDKIVDFWQQGGRSFCRQSDRVNLRA